MKDLEPGTTVNVTEDGVTAQFVVAKHNYEEAANGKGNTLLVRTDLLKDTVSWGSSYGTGQSYANSSNPRYWLNNTYAKRLSQDVLDVIKPVTIYYTAGNSNGLRALADQKFFIPMASDFTGENPLYPGIGMDFINGRFFQNTQWHGSYIYADTRETQDEDSSNSDNTGGYYYHLEFKWHGNGYGYVQRRQRQMPTLGEILVCFCVDENATVDDNGFITSNKAPEIESNYFGKDGTYGRWTGFRFAYKVSDPEGDAITVTEKIDDVVHKTFAAIQNGVYRFTLTKEELEHFEKNELHTLTVEAFDGRTTAALSCKVTRIRSPGYVVYIGRIKGTADGQSYYWTERNILDDPYNENAPFILDPELTLEANDQCSFTFTVPAVNPHYDKLEIRRPVISVEEDGREIFMGYIAEMETGLERDIDVTCVSELGWLQDKAVQVYTQFYTVKELVELALTYENDPDTHAGFHGEGRVFLPGNVTVAKPESDGDKETGDITDAWSVLTNSLTGKYGGYLRLRKEIKMVDGVRVYTRYLDYLAKLTDKTDQVIELGKNLLDVSYYVKAGDIVNSVVAYGWYTSGWWLWESTHPISAEAYDGASIERYGLCQRILSIQGQASSEESLFNRAKAELAKYSGFSGSLQVSAADLCDIDVDTDRLGFLKETYVLAEAHNIDDWLPCVKEVIPLHELDEKDFTFGATMAKLSSMQAGNFATAGAAWDAIKAVANK